MIYLQLFLSFLQIGAFSFGGGYAALPLIRHQVVEANGWLQLSEFTDLITISQMTPGPIAVNSATFCRVKSGRNSGSSGMYAGMCASVLYFGIIDCKVISQIFDSMDLLQGV